MCLGNDFQTIDNQLFIENLNTTGTAGQVIRALDGKSVFYTPQNGFIGRDVFSYTVVDQFGNRSSALVVVNVCVPIQPFRSHWTTPSRSLKGRSTEP